MYGWRGRIGIIYPCSGMRDDDFFRLAPKGVSVHVTRVSFRSEGTVEAIREMSSTERLVDAARLLAEVRPSCITWADTSGSFLFGHLGDVDQIRSIRQATHVPASTTSTACLAAFRALGITRLAVASPYLDEVNIQMKDFLESRGLSVVSLKALELRRSDDIARASAEAVYDLVRSARVPDANGMFIPCTDFLDIDIIGDLERDFGIPVVAANPATMWHALRLSRISDAVDGFGSLIKMTLPADPIADSELRKAASND